MATKITRAKIVLASLGLVIAGGSTSVAARVNSDPFENEQIARNLAGLPTKLPAGWRRNACSDVSGEQVFILTHPTGEQVCFLRGDAKGQVAQVLLHSTMAEVEMTPFKTGVRKVGGLDMVFAKGEGLWTPDAPAKVQQMQGIILLPVNDKYIHVASTNSRRQDLALRSTETLLNSIKHIPV